ncbi:hypothetical protein F441_11703 [Phytophthora nicotianae CJ01A1]|uniref:Uncharacterized protein n=3 Tax=Phytophthora nicotianae TaxID=4792 RepID=W2Q021_PHYN3|nr:hypothetical protein PPTG_23301 [Phytophthora nicotianae INRA-310]ETL36706.1 hypothetical protein L916_11362 [Phytophthora nicotianae]ETN06462.1 hypothetical protein PPTG_23301 [Phytophthora nicotianae INRA-310]ETP13025.1 hypothetical protein F441_11703 [Phytophthora nicotianae CJ01A1]
MVWVATCSIIDRDPPNLVVPDLNLAIEFAICFISMPLFVV